MVTCLQIRLRRAAHDSEVVFDLLPTTAGQERYDGLLVQSVVGEEGIDVARVPLNVFRDFIDRGVPYVMNGIMVFLLKKGYLKGQDGEELVDVSTYIANAVLFPSPNLGRDVVVHGYLGLGANVFGNG